MLWAFEGEVYLDAGNIALSGEGHTSGVATNVRDRPSLVIRDHMR